MLIEGRWYPISVSFEPVEFAVPNRQSTEEINDAINRIYVRKELPKLVRFTGAMDYNRAGNKEPDLLGFDVEIYVAPILCDMHSNDGHNVAVEQREVAPLLILNFFENG